MQIRDISTCVMGVPGAGGHAPARNWIFVRIETDTGITGVGEATTEYHEQAVVAMIEQHFAPMLVGQDPTGVTRLWEQMQRQFWWKGGVVASSAASGIEQALWDVTGKAYGLPVYKLLGGATRDRIRMYARADLNLASEVAELEAARVEGFTAFKCGLGEYVRPFDDRAQTEAALVRANELRAAGGPNVDLMMDCGGLFSVPIACRLIEGMRPLRFLFIEEPVNMDTPHGLVEVRRAFPGERIAAGERVLTRWGFREWLEQGAVNVVQADLCHCGGIGELLRIASWAETYNVQIAPHNPYGPVALAANAHAAAAMPNFLILEHCRCRPWFDEVQVSGPHVEGGYIYLDDRPGLGIELDWDYVTRHSYHRLPLRTFMDRDGGRPLC